MRLKHIKLSGFKSFVDTTKVAMPNNLIGIVGPNGCGKSNVIDAIRWVMGESSAKTLRGDNMEDVIFNGSAVRKPVNKAFVELVFDNSDGSAPGEYARYAEIGIRRELSREGGSKYFINKAKCRRKDIFDIFLGTGLGPRSYSIIEQGMVGRIVESKPDELRVLIEEAAGISKYKERRRETENRIRHTRDNLSRVEDIVGELETQLRRLKRQASEAERYKNLKEQQRELDSQLKTVRWSALHEQVQAKDVELERLQTEFESQISEQRDVETQIELMREEQVELTEQLNEAQAQYYSIGGEIAALEQNIQHSRQTRQQQEDEFKRLTESEREATQNLQMDQQRLNQVETEQVEVEPQLEIISEQYEEALERFQQAEQAHQAWQEEWEQLNQQAADPEKEREVQSARIEQHDRQIHHFMQRSEQVASTLADIEEKLNIDEVNELKLSVETIDEECQILEDALQQQDQSIVDLRQQLEDSREQYNQTRHTLQDHSARLSSQKALQANALGESNKKLNNWLQERGLDDNQRVASLLSVAAGWEKAVDTVLSRYLNALSVQQLDEYTQDMAQLTQGRVWLVDQSKSEVVVNETPIHKLLDSLSSKVSGSDIDVEGWFHGVYVAQSISDAMSHRDKLAAHESITTADGCWVGSNWAVFGQEQDSQSGVLQREADIEQLTVSVEQLNEQLSTIQQQGEGVQQQIKELDGQREQHRIEFRNKSHRRTDLHNQLARIEARSSELLGQREKLQVEKQQLTDQLAQAQDELAMAKQLMHDAQELASNFAQRRTDLSAQKEQCASQLEMAREQERAARDQRQVKQIEQERLQSNKLSLTESIERLQKQLENQLIRRDELAAILESELDPSEAMREQLQELLEKRLESEQKLSLARNALQEFENQMKNADQQRLGFDRQSKSVRDNLENVRMSRQELVVRRDTISEQLEIDIEQMLLLVRDLDESVNLQKIEQELADTSAKLARIGAVNLVAIDEYEQCLERKTYLDKQYDDLTEAMATLESAINKIDKETRSRFKDTFDSLNEGFKEFFPKLFGGGNAYLELTDTDLLNTGVSVMARPPGKRNSTIHLLSGGEKALTAVSLLFAFFDLNPAPFCVLDEVDAPLDDANVERYANVLKQLGKKTQLLFITHNKITMEVADILVGVTMAEAGVSRLVAVDVEQAASMAIQ